MTSSRQKFVNLTVYEEDLVFWYSNHKASTMKAYVVSVFLIAVSDLYGQILSLPDSLFKQQLNE